jgi:hypothetical protein
LRFAERLFGPEHYLSGYAMIHLGDQIRDLENDAGAAEALYQRGLELVTRNFGDSHLRLIHGLNSLATLRSRQGDHREAERIYRRVVSILGSSLGGDHPQVS